jgi:hypothetical protein
MKPGIVVILVLLMDVLMTDACTQAQEMDQSGLQSRIQLITSTFSVGNVSRIEVLQIPPRILTRSAVTPEMLEKSFHYKLVIQNPGSGAYRDKLRDALSSMSVRSELEIKDLRWAVLFYTRDGSRVGSLYFNKDGEYGAVDGKPASFRGDFFKWLESSFASCFQ